MVTGSVHADTRFESEHKTTNPKTPFKITGMEVVDAPEGLFKLSTRSVQDGQRYIISIEVTEPRQERSIRSQLKIQTDHPEMPEVATIVASPLTRVFSGCRGRITLVG